VSNLDFISIWNRTVREHRSGRWCAETDLAFWETHASSCAKTQLQTPNTLSAVRKVLKPTMTMLDVGAGAGRYALALASSVRWVTALDYSAAM
jgi:cyclopropane fatty-acyl-phospholipid synthase-like methyltransferase